MTVKHSDSAFSAVSLRCQDYYCAVARDSSCTLGLRWMIYRLSEWVLQLESFQALGAGT